jgi:integrase
MHFTQTNVQNIKPNAKKQWLTDDETRGLKLYIGPTGVKTWFYCRRDANKKVVTRKIGPFPDLTVAQAREQAQILGGKIATGEDIRKEKPVEKLTLRNFLITHYFPYVEMTLKSHRETIRALTVAFEPFFDKPIEEIDVLTVNKWRMSRREAGLRASSINRVVASLKSAFSWGLKNGLLEANPIALITPLKERDSKTIVRFLSEDEYKRLEAALIAREERKRRGRNSGNEWRDERKYQQKPKITGEFADFLRPAVSLALSTGIRRGALFALKWGDIDLDQQIITLRADDAKNGKTTRLPLSDDAADVLTSWKAQSTNTGPDDLVFPSPKTGKAMGEPKHAWQAVLKAAGIENFRWHDLRHTFASWLVMRGIDLNTVRELMGHADMKMTMRYAHLAPESKLNAVQVLNRRTKGDKIIGRIRKTAS